MAHKLPFWLHCKVLYLLVHFWVPLFSLSLPGVTHNSYILKILIASGGKKSAELSSVASKKLVCVRISHQEKLFLENELWIPHIWPFRGERTGIGVKEILVGGCELSRRSFQAQSWPLDHCLLLLRIGPQPTWSFWAPAGHLGKAEGQLIKKPLLTTPSLPQLKTYKSKFLFRASLRGPNFKEGEKTPHPRKLSSNFFIYAFYKWHLENLHQLPLLLGVTSHLDPYENKHKLVQRLWRSSTAERTKLSRLRWTPPGQLWQ